MRELLWEEDFEWVDQRPITDEQTTLPTIRATSSDDHQVGSHEAFKEHLFEARIAEWMRNILSIGFVATTAIVNARAEMEPTDRLIITGAGLAAAAASYWGLDRDRRYALHQSRQDARFATINAKQEGREVPKWAQGSTGRIFEDLELENTT